MLSCFEGLEKWLPLFVREEPIDMIDRRILGVDQVELAEAEVEDPLDQFQDRQALGAQSPLRRAAHAALANLKARGVDLYAVHFHGGDIENPVTPYFLGFQLSYVKSAHMFQESQWT